MAVPIAPKWVTDLIMNLLHDAEQPLENRLTAEQHLNVVPHWIRTAASAILGYQMQRYEAAAPPADDATAPLPYTVPLPTPPAAAPVSTSDAVTAVIPLNLAPQAETTVPANAPGR
jgi:hypothetical protein